ncbi:MAG: RNase P subunit p30 family protein [Halobacteriales archaeon]
MYEAVRARPAGPSTVARLAATAAEYGYDGLVILNPPDEPPEYDPAAIQQSYGIDVVAGLELDPQSPNAASGSLGHHRPETTVLALAGGPNGLNEFAVSQDKLDVLSGPMAGDVDLDHGLVQAAAHHGVKIAVELGPVLRCSGQERTHAISDLRKLRELIEAYDAPYVVTGSPASHLELRSPRELAAVGSVAGFERAAIETGLEEWQTLADRNRERLSADHITPGVRRGQPGGEE